MTPPTTAAALVVRVQAAFDRFLQAIAALHADELLAPRLPGGWSVKDVLAHLAWWGNAMRPTISSTSARCA